MVSIAIDFDIAKAHGANAAIVHQQVSWWIKNEDHLQRPTHRPGWFTGSAHELAGICPLTTKQIRTAMAVLLDAGLMEKAKIRAQHGDQTCSYRPVDSRSEPLDSAFALQGNSGDAPEGKSGDAPEGKCSSLSELLITNDCASGDAQVLGLFPDSIPSQTTKRTRSKPKRRAYGADFLAWWEQYPLKANKADAWDIWPEVDQAAVTVALGHYNASLAAHAEKYPGSVVSPLYATVFLNGRWENWESGIWLNPYWPKTASKSGGDASSEITAAFEIASKAWRDADLMPGGRAANIFELLAEHPRIAVAIRKASKQFAAARTVDQRRTAFEAAWVEAANEQAVA